jgi:biotin--[acetyl-coA-carboxylase] ligase
MNSFSNSETQHLLSNAANSHKTSPSAPYFVADSCEEDTCEGCSASAKAQLPPHWIRKHYPTVPTTMEMIAMDAAPAGEVWMVSTDFQTRGHGQVGTLWESDCGENLMFTFVYRPKDVRATEQFYLSEIACLAVAQTLDAYVEGVSVKWPNDVYVGEKKICGMLLNHQLKGAMVESTMVGIGINVNQSQFVSDAPNPISLQQLLGHRIDTEAVLESFVRHFETLYMWWIRGEKTRLRNLYQQRLFRREGQHLYLDSATGEVFSATIEQVAPTGLLTLRDSAGALRTFDFKAIQFQLDTP